MQTPSPDIMASLGFGPSGYNIPIVVENDGRNERSFDLFSRLLRDRIVILGTQVDSASMRVAIAQLLFLEAEIPGKPIQLYINSPGGSVIDGLALYDTMQLITSPVHTLCIGMAASMGSFLLSAGHPGERRCLPNGEVMIHELSSGSQGKYKDMKAAWSHTQRLHDKLTRLLAENCGKDFATLESDMQLDKWFTAEEALEYGIIDEIVGCTRAQKAARVASSIANVDE